MKLQVALDRLSEETALQLADTLKEDADIIEIGTSFIKEFGVSFMKKMRKQLPETCLLADIKIVDEAEYESRLYYEAGADIITVMGSSATSTLSIVQSCAKTYGRRYMIDLMNADKQMMQKVAQFDDAIFCIHMPKDAQEDVSTLLNIKKELPKGCCIAVAGGITFSHIERLVKSGVDIAVVGGSIVKSKNPYLALNEMKERGRTV